MSGPAHPPYLPLLNKNSHPKVIKRFECDVVKPKRNIDPEALNKPINFDLTFFLVPV